MLFTLSLALRMTIFACPLGGIGVLLSGSGPDQLGYCFLLLPPLGITFVLLLVIVVVGFFLVDDINKIYNV